MHDVKGWSGDIPLNEGRRPASLALRVEYRQRYLAEPGYRSACGGDDKAAADRDTAAVAVGLPF